MTISLSVQDNGTEGTKDDTYYDGDNKPARGISFQGTRSSHVFVRACAGVVYGAAQNAMYSAHGGRH